MHETTSFLTIKPPLQATPSPVSSLGGTPSALRPGNALGTLGELGALRSAGVAAGEQATTLTSFASQRQERRTHALT